MNDKLKNENVKNKNDNLEDLSSQEANVETIEKKDEVESLSERKKSIKDYLSKDLFADVKSCLLYTSPRQRDATL